MTATHRMVLSKGTKTVIELLAAEARIDGNQRLVGFCRRALRGDDEAFVSCFRSMGTESNLENWHLLDANTGDSLDCSGLNVCAESYAQLILQSLLASDTGIVAAPNGQRVYAEVK